jgi:pimeloyl-ACP methyl ester carboxylesterase
MPTIALPDGRRAGYQEWGDAAGLPLFHLHGTPDCRLSRPPDADQWRRHRLRVITMDRPGYGLSTPLPGRRVSHIAADVAALATALGIGRFAVTGSSGGGPHALACAALLGERVLGCAPMCSAAPWRQTDIAGLIGLNRDAYRVLTEEGRPGLVRFLGDLRELLLDDPVGAFQAQVADAPATDIEWNARADVLVVRRESILEALRPGVDGWVDDAMALNVFDWGVDLSAVACPTRFWHGDGDKNAPLAAVERVVARVPGARLHRWPGEGHSASWRHLDEVLDDLVAVIAAQA